MSFTVRLRQHPCPAQSTLLTKKLTVVLHILKIADQLFILTSDQLTGRHILNSVSTHAQE